MPAEILDAPPSQSNATPNEPQASPPNAGSSPAATFNDDFDVAALDPANLVMQAMPGARTAAAQSPPKDEDEEEEKTPPTTENLVTDPNAITTQSPKNDTTPQNTKPESVNVRALRQRKEELERQNNELAAKLADLEPRAKGYEAEKARLEQALAEKEQAIAEAQAAVWRQNAHEKPEWKQTAESIYAVGRQVGEILNSPVLREAGLKVTPAIILDPNNRQALNETIRILNENGQYAEASMLMQHHGEVNRMRGELRRIEKVTSEEAEAWRTNADAAEAGVFRTVRESLAASNPIFDSRSPQYQSLPKEQQEFLNQQIMAAEQEARNLRQAASKPEEMLSSAFRSSLSMRLLQQANSGMQVQLQSIARENSELKARIEKYEQAAGGGVAPGVNSSNRVNAGNNGFPDDISELAKMLDPQNLPGYRGI